MTFTDSPALAGHSLAEEDERLVLGLLASPGFPGLVVLDSELARVVFANGRARAILGAAGIGLGFDVLREVFLAEGVEGAEPGTVRRLGSAVLGYSLCVRGPHTAVVFREISGRLAGEANALAQAESALLRDLFSVLRHEVGNPLNSAKTALSVLRASLGSASSEAVVTYVDRSLAELLRVERILKGLGRFEALQPQAARAVPVAEALGRALEQARRAPLPEGVTLSAAEPPAGAAVLADPEALDCVLGELLAAALQSFAPGRPGRVRIAFERGGESLGHVRISDEGNGMDEEEVRGLFRPREIDDSGELRVGLAAARRLVAGMKGSIAVSSVPGSGTTYVVSLPLAEPP